MGQFSFTLAYLTKTAELRPRAKSARTSCVIYSINRIKRTITSPDLEKEMRQVSCRTNDHSLYKWKARNELTIQTSGCTCRFSRELKHPLTGCAKTGAEKNGRNRGIKLETRSPGTTIENGKKKANEKRSRVVSSKEANPNGGGSG